MLTTLDRYLIRRFLYVFGVFTITLYGLFVVFDLFTNVDEFSKTGGDASAGLLAMFGRIAVFYAIQFTAFFEMAGPIMSIISVIVVLAMIHKNTEIQPILAAGIPTFRMVIPFLIGVGVINIALILNQEFVIPTFSQQLQTGRGDVRDEGQAVEPLYDYDRDGTAVLHIDGDRIHLASRKLTEASFTMKPPKLARQLMTIKSSEAIFFPPSDKRSQSGWLLKGISEPVDLENLTDRGRESIVPQRDSPDLFIVSDVSFDQLYNRTRNHAMVSTVQLAQRIRLPSTGTAPVRSQQLHLHFRFTRPLLAFAMVFTCVPLVLRRESRSLIGNMAICSLVMGTLYIIGQACLYLGGTSLVQTDLAAWLPVIICGGTAAFLSTAVQT